MIDLKQLLDEWKDDCKISEMHLDETSRQVPVLHSKYLDKLMNAKLILKKSINHAFPYFHCYLAVYLIFF